MVEELLASNYLKFLIGKTIFDTPCKLKMVLPTFYAYPVSHGQSRHINIINNLSNIIIQASCM